MNVEPVQGTATFRAADAIPRTRGGRGKSQWAIAWQSLRRDKAALFGAGLVLSAIVIAVVGPWLAPHDPTVQIATERMARPLSGGA